MCDTVENVIRMFMEMERWGGGGRQRVWSERRKKKWKHIAVTKIDFENDWGVKEEGKGEKKSMLECPFHGNEYSSYLHYTAIP